MLRTWRLKLNLWAASSNASNLILIISKAEIFFVQDYLKQELKNVMSITPFYVGTFENKASNERPIIFEPPQGNPYEPFPITDPFGLRTAITPLLKRDINGLIEGVGTAFHIDGWGTFLTADHVVEFAREYPRSAKQWTEISPNSNGDHAIIFLGLGLIVGKVNIPHEAFVLVERIGSLIAEKDDPLTYRTEPINVSDLAVLNVNLPQTIATPHSIPVNVGYNLSIGETVLAIGFPGGKSNKFEENAQNPVWNEEMYGAYGRITKIYPSGRGSSTPTPVFEVECNWLSGMSGGPVFNSRGEAIGLVSRSLSPVEDDPNPSVGWATHFGLAPRLREMLVSLDVLNAGWRRGWAVLRENPWHLAKFFRTEEEAHQLALSMTADYQVRYGSNQFFTDNFMW